MEEKILSIMLYSPLMEEKKDIFKFITSDMFLFKENRKIFNAIKALFENNNDVFSLIKLNEFYLKVIEKLNNDKLAEKIIKELVFEYENVLAANLNYYITELQNKYFNFMLQEISNNGKLTFYEKKQAIKELETQQEKVAINYEYKEGIITFSDCFDDIYRQNYETDDSYYLTEWQAFNRLVKIRTGYLMVVSGYPSRGKSTFVDNLLVNLSKKYDMKHLIASFETDNATHYNTLAEMYAQKTAYELKKQDELFKANFDFVESHFIKLDNKRQWTIDDICKRAEYAKEKYGIKTLVIDPYNKLKRDFRDREDLFVGRILSQLCSLAKRLDILVIFVAHPKKPDDEIMPNMYSISGSSDWYNMTDYGIIVHRSIDPETKKLDNMPKISVQKVKNFFLGNPAGGEIQLIYSKDKRVLKDNLEEL